MPINMKVCIFPDFDKRREIIKQEDRKINKRKIERRKRKLKSVSMFYTLYTDRQTYMAMVSISS